MGAEIRAASPSRRRPAAASTSASNSPASSLRSRVSTFPRTGANRPRHHERRKLRDAPDAARADRRSPRRGAPAPPAKSVRADAVAQHARVARILARQHRGDVESLGQHGRHVLGAVHRKVDLAREQRVVDLLHEQPLAAGVGSGACCSRSPVVVMTTSSTRDAGGLEQAGDRPRLPPARARCRACRARASRSTRPSPADLAGRRLSLRLGRAAGIVRQAEQPVERVRVGAHHGFVARRP